MVPVRRVLSDRAPLCGTNRSALAAWSTLSRVAFVTLSRPLRAREAVATETFANRATSRIVAPRLPPGVLNFSAPA
jgi:hypothetical protein